MKTRILTLISTAVIAVLASCGGSPQDDYNIAKRYWDLSDYQMADPGVRLYEGTENFISLSNPETRAVFVKMMNTENFKVVLDDESLGLNFRSKFAEDLFDLWIEWPRAYSIMDRQDKYKYGADLVQTLKFGLELQPYYFLLGNEKIVDNSVDPEANDVKSVLKGNEQILVDNFGIYLKYLKSENKFNETDLPELAKVYEDAYLSLIEKCPEANYSGLGESMAAVMAKSNSSDVQAAAANIMFKIKEKLEEDTEDSDSE